MGGNALKDKTGKNAITHRINKKYYDMVKDILLKFLKPIVFCDTVPELPGKETFGDIDILYRNEKNLDVIGMLKNEYKPKYTTKNGNTFTFSLDCNIFGLDVLFQIDCKCVTNFEMVKWCDAYGDISTIVGMMMNYCGLKYGGLGLWYNVVKYDMKEKLLLSDIPSEIFNFLGLDFDFFVNIVNLDKDDYDRIFEWIIKSKFFKSKAFIKIDRETARPFFKLFLEYIAKNNINVSCDIDNCDELAIKYFKKEQEYLDMIKKFDVCHDRKLKFCGKMLIDKKLEIKGIKLESKNVGVEIDKFRNFCVSDNNYSNWNDFLDRNTKEYVLEMLEKFIVL